MSCAQLPLVNTPGLSRGGFSLKGGIDSVRSWLRDVEETLRHSVYLKENKKDESRGLKMS